MRNAFFASILAILGAGSTLAQGVGGTVLDQGGAAIPGANIKLTCGSSVFRSTTDQKGSFTLKKRPSYDGCTLFVSKDKFAPYSQALDARPALLEIKLAIATVRETVHIEAKSEENVLDSVVLSRSELNKISNDPAELTAYAQQLAGAAPVPSHTYVDGLPSTNLPPTAVIDTVAVNRDPFSSEYADGDQNRIEITTRSPERKWHLSLGGSSIGLGGDSAMGSHLGSSSKWTSPILTGPMPYAPLAFSLQANFSSNWSQQLVQPVSAGGSPSISQISTGGDSNSESFNLYYSGHESTRAYVLLYRSEATAENSGVGGLTVMQAGSGTGFESDGIRGFLQNSGTNWVLRSAIMVERKIFSSAANDTDVGFDIPGYFVSGGAPIADEHSVKDRWMWKTVFQSTWRHHAWEWGFTISHSTDLDQQIPNPAGQMWFPSIADYDAALTGAPTGTWIGARHSGLGLYGSTVASPFFHADIWRTSRFVIRGGIRTDYQSLAGIEVSPRLSATTQVHGFILRQGAGLFVHEWPSSIFFQAMRDNALDPFVASGVVLPPDGTGVPTSSLQEQIITQLAPGIERPRDVMLRSSIERPLGSFDAGFEFGWVDGKHLLGSRRIPDNLGWLDLLESNRDLRRTELHPRIRYKWRGQALTANYEWIHSRDDTDGPFSYAEFYNDLPAEWARSTGIPAHNASLIGNLNLPRSFFLTIVGSIHSSSPYNVTTGRDIDNDGLFNDRGGLLRNSGNGPDYRSVSLYGSRRVSLDRLLHRRRKGSGINMGLEVDDLLGNRNYLTLEAVEDSPLFGQPLSALPGRTVRLWFNLGE
jgi:Carboxypeptidase regulatory-like domain